MERKFSFSDARKLFQRHQELQNRIHELEETSEKYRVSVKEATERYIAIEVLKLMRDIPVEEVNRDKRGIRVKALRDSGYSTYADIFTASVYQLASVRGISEDGAHVVKKIVSNASITARKTIKLKLSVDNKSAETTRLVLEISKYQKAQELTRASEQLSGKFSYDVKNALDDIQSSTGFFKWIFSSKDKKEKAIEAYRFLQENIQGEYGKEVYRLSEEQRKLETYSNSEAWDKFQEHSIQYINTIEDIEPGVLGNNDAVYGLPEDLAREVQEECFSRMVCYVN